jgi:hypothetical protein
MPIHEPRPRNLVRPDEMPFAAGIRYRDGEPLVLDGGDYPQALRRAAERVDYAGVDLPCANKHCRQVSPARRGAGSMPARWMSARGRAVLAPIALDGVIADMT